MISLKGNFDARIENETHDINNFAKNIISIQNVPKSRENTRYKQHTYKN